MSAIPPVGFFGGSTGGGEVVLILVVALLLFGSRNLPQVARTIGKTLEQFRRAANEVRDEVMRADLEDPPPRSLPPPPTALPPSQPKAPVQEDGPDERVAR